MSGSIPKELAKLKLLTTLELYGAGLSGAVPELPFAQYEKCFLNDYHDHWNPHNTFACPLPPGATTSCDVHCVP
jgi:hypothetical protein